MIIKRTSKGHMKCPLVTSINDLNQVLKKYSNEYYIHLKSGLVSFDHTISQLVTDIMCIVKSTKTLNLLRDEFGYNTLIKFKAENIYTCIKEHKPLMEMIAIEDDKIMVHMSQGPSIQIGTIVDPDYELKMTDGLSYKMSMLNKLQHVPYLSEDEVSLIVNSILTKDMTEDYSVRVTKELIPGISLNTDVKFYVNTDAQVEYSSGFYTDFFILSDIKGVDVLMLYKILQFKYER